MFCYKYAAASSANVKGQDITQKKMGHRKKTPVNHYE